MLKNPQSFLARFPKIKKSSINTLLKMEIPLTKMHIITLQSQKKMINFNLSIGYSYLKFSIIS